MTCFSDEYSENTTNQITYQKNLSFKEKTNSLFYTNFKISSSNSNEDYMDKEIRLFDTLDKLAPHYQQLENLLSHLPQSNRASILGPILNTALNDENPIAFINSQLEGFRRARTRNRMLDDISKSYGWDKILLRNC